jgi:hypothetical protein
MCYKVGINLVRKSLPTLADSTADVGKFVRNYQAPTSLEGLRYVPMTSNSADLSGEIVQFASKVIRKPKEIIKMALGEGTKVSRDWQDLACGISGLKALFGKRGTHYVYSKPLSGGAKAVERGHISCHYDANDILSRFYVFDWNTRSVRLFNGQGKLITHFTPEQTKAMLTYKSDSRGIHHILRNYGKASDCCDLDETIKHLSQVFKEGKTSVTNDWVTGYRALDSVSLKKILAMPEDGMIFVDPSFMSVATNKRSVLPFLNFRNFKHILKVEIPPNTKYLNLDEIGHIINPQKSENEMVLEAGTRLLIKKRDGMIFAELINNK